MEINKIRFKIGVGIMSFCNLYKKPEDVNSQYWDELRVNFEKIDERGWESLLLTLLEDMKTEDKKNICALFEITVNMEDDDVSFSKISKHVYCKFILYLREFLNRKKRAVEEFYEIKFSKVDKRYDSSTLIKLIHLFFSNPSNLFQVFVLHEWKSKATGQLFQCDTKFTKTHLKELNSNKIYQDNLINTLYKNSGQQSEYKILAHCQLSEEHYIYLLYKLCKDSKRPDFDRAKRIKDIDTILFSVRLGDKKIIEIKTPTKTEVRGIRKYIEENIGSNLSDIKEKVFTEYEPQKLTEVFFEGKPASGSEPEDFMINRIVFSNSLITKSPEIVIQLHKSDIWLSVVDAFKRQVIDLKSLRDINQIKFTSNHHSRLVRSTILDNGNVLFKLDDSGLDEKIKNSIAEKFLQKFGVPLNQPIENKLSYGEAEQIDYLLRRSTDYEISSDLAQIYNELKAVNILTEKNDIIYKCLEEPCGYESKDLNDFRNNCIRCQSDKYKTINNIEIVCNHNTIDKLISNCLTKVSKLNVNIELLKTSKLKIRGNEYLFRKFKFNKKPYQILVSGSILSPQVIDHIERQLIPTIIIYFGIDKQQAEIYTPNTIENLSFGLVYLNREKQKFEEIIVPILLNLEERVNHHISSVALKANNSLKMVSDKTEELKGLYDADKLEDEVFPLIRDMIPNSEKWGHEYRGKTLPEGIFALQYIKDSGAAKHENKRIFSYDCKFTTDKTGFDLNSDEKRKGTDYVKRLNELHEVSSYCTTRQISAHVFISNKFKTGQIETMAKYFYELVGPDYQIKPVFLEVKELQYLHSMFIKNKEIIMKVPDIFFELLYELLIPEDNIVTREKIDDLIDDVCTVSINQYALVDAERVTKKLLKKS